MSKSGRNNSALEGVSTHGHLLAKLSIDTLIQQFYLYSSHGDDLALEAEHTTGLGVCSYSTAALLMPFCQCTSTH